MTPPLDYCPHARGAWPARACGMVQEQPVLDQAGNATGKKYKWCYLCDIDEAKAKRTQRRTAKRQQTIINRKENQDNGRAI